MAMEELIEEKEFHQLSSLIWLVYQQPTGLCKIWHQMIILWTVFLIMYTHLVSKVALVDYNHTAQEIQPSCPLVTGKIISSDTYDQHGKLYTFDQ